MGGRLSKPSLETGAASFNRTGDSLEVLQSSPSPEEAPRRRAGMNQLPEELLLLILGALPCADTFSEMPHIRDVCDPRNARRNASLVCKKWRRLLSSLPHMGRCAGELSGPSSHRTQRPISPVLVKAFVKWGRQHNLVAVHLEPCRLSFTFLTALKPLCREGRLRVLELGQVEARRANFRALSVLTSLQSLSLSGTGCMGDVQVKELNEGLRPLLGLQRLELDMCNPAELFDFKWLSELTGLTNLVLDPSLFLKCVTELPLLECLTLQRFDRDMEDDFFDDYIPICFHGCVFGTQLTSLCLRQVFVEGQRVSLGSIKRLEVRQCIFGMPSVMLPEVIASGAWYDCLCVQNLEELLYYPLLLEDYISEGLSKCLACQLASQTSLRVLHLTGIPTCGLCPCRGTCLSVAELKLSFWHVDEEWEDLLEDFPKLEVLSLAIGTAQLLQVHPELEYLEDLLMCEGVSLRLFSGIPSNGERYSLALGQYDNKSRATQLPLPVEVVERTSAGVKEWVSKAVLTEF